MRAESHKRRSQAERSMRTKNAIIQAAVKVLAKEGYSGTTTTKIVRKAKVSRGALVHHFSSKADLLQATVKHLFSLKEVEFKNSFYELPQQDRTLEKAVDLLWKIMDGETYQAMVELLLASRSNSEVASVIKPLFEGLVANVAENFRQLFPAVASETFGLSIPAFAFATIQGAVFLRESGLTEVSLDVIEILKLLAKFVVPELSVERINELIEDKKEAI